MKKLNGWLLIIFCLFFLIIFAIALVAIIPGILAPNENFQMSSKEILTTSIGFIIIISLLIFGLINGIQKVRKEKVIETVEYDKNLNINLTGQIAYNDYRNLILGLSFKKPIFFVGLAIMLFFLLAFIVNAENMINQFDNYYFIFILIGIFMISPLFTLIQIKRLYNSNKILQKQLNYTLTNDSIQIKGNAVDSIQAWSNFYQIRVTKNFFMFYQGEMVATILEKKMFSESELQDFQNFIKSLNVKRI